MIRPIFNRTQLRKTKFLLILVKTNRNEKWFSSKSPLKIDCDTIEIFFNRILLLFFVIFGQFYHRIVVLRECHVMWMGKINDHLPPISFKNENKKIWLDPFSRAFMLRSHPLITTSYQITIEFSTRSNQSYSVNTNSQQFCEWVSSIIFYVMHRKITLEFFYMGAFPTYEFLNF